MDTIFLLFANSFQSSSQMVANCSMDATKGSNAVSANWLWLLIWILLIFAKYIFTNLLLILTKLIKYLRIAVRMRHKNFKKSNALELVRALTWTQYFYYLRIVSKTIAKCLRIAMWMRQKVLMLYLQTDFHF